VKKKKKKAGGLVEFGGDSVQMRTVRDGSRRGSLYNKAEGGLRGRKPKKIRREESAWKRNLSKRDKGVFHCFAKELERQGCFREKKT